MQEPDRWHDWEDERSSAKAAREQQQREGVKLVERKTVSKTNEKLLW